jgi:hypothetical protein
MNENNKQTYRGMIVSDHPEYLYVSITGKDQLFKLYKSDPLCLSIFEPLTRFEFETDNIDSEHITINEIVRFDNVLKIKHKNQITNLLAKIDGGIKQGELHTNELYELQNLFKGEHIPYSVYGFHKLRELFWLTDLIKKLDDLERSEPGKSREEMINLLQKRNFLMEQHPDQKSRFEKIINSFQDSAKDKSFTKKNRVLVAESEAPGIGDVVEFPFLKKLGELTITHVGKSFILTDTIKTVNAATKKRLEGKMVCWVYYEPKETIGKEQTKPKDKEDQYRPRSIEEVDKYLERVRKQFELDGIKPRNNTAYVADFRSGTDICDMRPLNKPYWFLIASANIWYINSEPSTAIMHHNLQISGVNCVGYVLTKTDYPDIVNSLTYANKSVQEIRAKISTTRF